MIPLRIRKYIFRGTSVNHLSPGLQAALGSSDFGIGSHLLLGAAVKQDGAAAYLMLLKVLNRMLNVSLQQLVDPAPLATEPDAQDIDF
jgi:hypothetical protein